LHDAQVVKNGKKRSDENDDRQNLESEDHAKGSRLDAQGTEDEVAARFGVIQHGVDAGPESLEDLAEIGLQHQQGDGHLQAHAPEHDAKFNGALVGGKQPRYRQDDHEAEQPGKALHQGRRIS
jgi:hypothetical protein